MILFKKMKVVRWRKSSILRVFLFTVITFFFFYFYKRRSSVDKNVSDPELMVRTVDKLPHARPPREYNPANNSNHIIVNGIEVFRDIDYELEELIKQDEDTIIPGLGDNGVPILSIPGVSQEEMDNSYKVEAMNRILSDRISYIRKLPDARNPLCAGVKIDKELPSASVIIIFNNEAWSTLIRTVHSVLLRSPEKFLKEIILVDDTSDRDDLQAKLDYYIQTRLPEHVKLIRLTERSGLIRARLAGAKKSTGDVLVFLDAHCEAGINWLEPILMRIKYKRDAVVMPIIDVVDAKHFGYMYDSESFSFQIGGFTWSGFFTWIDISQRERDKLKSPIDPVMSPTMAGGLLAINQQYFWNLGSYDSKMEIWGGENLEMSFRIWQCGGTLEVLPCSRVGHVFRSFHPYSFDGKKDTHGINTVRLAEVWMDDYKRFFYMNRPDLKGVNVGELRDRQNLRDKLNCKSFSWYLQNIYPEKFIPDENSLYWGRARSKNKHLCFDTLQKNEDSDHNLGVYYCHTHLTATQYFALSTRGQLRREVLCAEVIGSNVTMVKCNGGYPQQWVYTKIYHLKHAQSGLCISTYGLDAQQEVNVEPCTLENEYLKWEWEYGKNDEGTVIKHF